ncbi:MAG: DUF3144 domain-containing protein [Methylophilaceae bacterium]
MAEQNNENEMDMLVMADQFINTANALVGDSKQDVSRVGGAMCYAVARFNAHEASSKTTDLVATRDEAIEWFSNQYKEMLTDNIDQYIELAKQQADKQLSASKA